MRDAESILGKVISMNVKSAKDVRELLGVTDLAKLTVLADHLIKNNKEKAVGHIDKVAKEGVDLQQFTDNFIQYMRKLLLLKLSPSSKELLSADLTEEEKATAAEQVSELTEKQIYVILREFIAAEQDIKNSPLPQLPLELAVVNICSKD